jgi:Domain of unknown function (DUF4399)
MMAIATRRMIIGAGLGLACLALSAAGAAAQTAPHRIEAPKGAAVYFHYPLNGITVPSTFKVLIGLHNMGVAPAGIDKPNTGHHHLIVDAPLPPPDEPVPNDPQHIHLGGGQTEVELTLPPGRHTLQLLVADKDHVSFYPPVVSPKITITVAATGASQ